MICELVTKFPDKARCYTQLSMTYYYTFISRSLTTYEMELGLGGFHLVVQEVWKGKRRLEQYVHVGQDWDHILQKIGPGNGQLSCSHADIVGACRGLYMVKIIISITKRDCAFVQVKKMNTFAPSLSTTRNASSAK
jgi:hypothetical protein